MPDKNGKRAGHVVSLGINIAILVVMNRLAHWNLSFLLESYRDVLWAINLSLGVQIGVYAILAVHPSPVFRSIGQVLIGAFSIVALAVILKVFPVDFSVAVGPWLNTVFRVVLIVGIVGSAVSIVVYLAKMPGAIRKPL